MNKFKVFDRVAIYSVFGRITGIITRIILDTLVIEADSSKCDLMEMNAHYKQCRLLKKKDTKFKVGDWIDQEPFHEDGMGLWKIVGFDGKYYKLTTREGTLVFINSPTSEEYLIYNNLVIRPPYIKPFDPTKPVKTIGGLKARIICTDFKDYNYPILALVQREEGKEMLHMYTENGMYLKSCVERLHNQDNLINIPE